MAKTGTLTDVKALSGVLDGADDEPVQFSLDAPISPTA